MRGSCAILVVLALAGVGCQMKPSGGTGNAGYVDDEYQAQIDTFNRQATEQDELTERSAKLIEQQESEAARTTKLLEQQESDTAKFTKMLADQMAQSERYEKLLAKWEEQARRMDAVLAAQEKQAGIKPANSN